MTQATPSAILHLGPLSRAGVVFGALTDLAWCASFIAVWRQPGVFGAGDVELAFVLLIVEFLLLHATGFLFATSVKVPGERRNLMLFAGFAVFYLLFAGALSRTVDNWLPFGLMFGLVIGDFTLGLLSRSDGITASQVLSLRFWLVRVVLFLVAVFLCLFIPLPQGGVELEPGAGAVWDAEPYRGLATGALFFALAALDRLIVAWRGQV